MRILITGMNGTVAPALAAHLRHTDRSIVAWNRSLIPVDPFEAGRDFIVRTRPDCFIHLAMGSPIWAEKIARTCGEQGITFLFTSSVSVYSNRQKGPFAIHSVPQPDDDYGRYKLECEQRVRAANPEALIARLGWQIGTAPGSNNMIDYLETTHNREGHIAASRHWYPACSFLQDTAAALDQLIQNHPAGLYHLDANPGLSLFDIATRLNEIHGSRWKVVRAEEPTWNTRMTDARIQTSSIAERLSVGPQPAPSAEP